MVLMSTTATIQMTMKRPTRAIEITMQVMPMANIGEEDGGGGGGAGAGAG